MVSLWKYGRSVTETNWDIWKLHSFPQIWIFMACSCHCTRVVCVCVCVCKLLWCCFAAIPSFHCSASSSKSVSWQLVHRASLVCLEVTFAAVKASSRTSMNSPERWVFSTLTHRSRVDLPTWVDEAALNCLLAILTCMHFSYRGLYHT